LGDALFTHHSDVEREQNVVIYLTPYIVRKSDDLQKLKSMLSELEEVQERYNNFFEKSLEEKTGVPAAEIASEATAPASSRRIQRNNLSILEGEG
jgi:general secretion pathway protein D